MTSSAAEALQARFGLPGIAHITTGHGGLSCVRITSPAASGELYLHGAHVSSWHPAGTEEMIFVSRNAQWADGEAIRGGVPICSPWFRGKDDDPSAPKHGFVRTKPWNLESIEPVAEGVRVILSTTNDEKSRRWWPYEFTMRLRATFGAALRMELDYTSHAAEPVTVAEALHTYLVVGNVRQISISGLDGTRYRDNLDGNREKQQQGDVRFTGEKDNAYLDTETDLILTDPVLKRRIHVVKSGSQSTVTWNPSIEGAQRIPDLGDDEWPRFACVEACNVMDCALMIAPGETHTLSSTIAWKTL